MYSYGVAHKLYEHLFRGVNYNAPGQKYLMLMQNIKLGDLTANQRVQEVSGSGYQRLPFLFGPSNGKGAGSNATELVWNATGLWTPALAAAVVDSPSGAGDVLSWTALDTPVVGVVDGDTIRIPVDALKFNLNARRKPEWYPSNIPNLFAWTWAGYFGENCSITKDGSNGNWQIRQADDLSGNGNHFVSSRPCGLDLGHYRSRDQRGGFFSNRFATLAVHNFNNGGSHFANVYEFSNPPTFTGEFYLATAFYHYRPNDQRVMWGANSAQDYVQLQQGSGDYEFFGNGVKYNLGRGGFGFHISEIWRDGDGMIHHALDGVEIGLINYPADWRCTGWGWEGVRGSSQWDDWLFELVVCDGPVSAEHRAQTYKHLDERWRCGRYDHPLCGTTDWLADQIYGHLFLGNAITPPAEYRLALADKEPGNAATGGAMNEVSLAGYSRQILTMDDDVRERGIGSNLGAMSFGPAQGNWGRVPAHWAITDSEFQGDGNAYFWGPLPSPGLFRNGDPLNIRKGDLTVNFTH